MPSLGLVGPDSRPAAGPPFPGQGKLEAGGTCREWGTQRRCQEERGPCPLTEGLCPTWLGVGGCSEEVLSLGQLVSWEWGPGTLFSP